MAASNPHGGLYEDWSRFVGLVLVCSLHLGQDTEEPSESNRVNLGVGLKRSSQRLRTHINAGHDVESWVRLGGLSFQRQAIKQISVDRCFQGFEPVEPGRRVSPWRCHRWSDDLVP